MDINEIAGAFTGRKGKPFDINRYYAVLVPLIEIGNVPSLLYQVRADNLGRQPGEVSFPGGMIEEGENSKEAAIRETVEEMGIARGNIEVIGELDYILDSRNDLVYPILGKINNIDFQDIKFSREEVSEVFAVPIEFLIKNRPETHEMSYNVNQEGSFPFSRIKNGKTYRTRSICYPVYFYDYDGHIIWGLTAKITRNFIKELIGKGLRQ